MRVFGKVALAAGLLSLVAAPTTAQSWKWDWGINGGYSWISNLLDTDQTMVDEESGGSRIRLDQGFLVGSQLTMWASPKFGLRANFRYGSRDAKGSGMGGADDFDFVENVHLWGGTIDALLRFKSPASEFTKMEMLPYLALGAGLKWVNPAADLFTCVDQTEDKSWSCGPFTTGLPGNPRAWAIGEQPVLLGHVGLGADWRLSRTLALRTEISDQIYRPQTYETSLAHTNRVYTLPDGDDNESNTVHEIGGQIGLHFLFGVPRPVAVAVVPAPPVTAPPVEQPPVRPQPPREDMITVCVIDPTAPGGIRMQTAYYRYEPRDTVVEVNGQRIALRNAVGNVMVASNADWYVRGAPLAMTIGSERVEFTTTGTPRMVTASDLAFLGTINGLAIYADREDVKDIREELDELNRAQRGTDLGKILEEHKDLREDLSSVKAFFVPLQPTGCVFQSLQMQEAVRKGRQ